MAITDSINLVLLPMKAHYFLFFAGTAATLPFLPVFAQGNLGITEVGIGVIYAVLPFLGLLTKTALGFVADKFEKRRLIFLSSVLATGVFMFVIQFSRAIPPMPESIACQNELLSLRRYISNHDNCTVALHNVVNEKVMCNLSCTGFTCDAIHDQEEICSSEKEEVRLHIFLDARNYSFEESCILFPLLRNDSTFPVKGDCKGFHSTSCKVTCDDPGMKSCLDEVSYDDYIYTTGEFWIYFVLIAFAWCSMAIAISLSDTICFLLLGSHPERFGNERLWGTIGWGIIGLSIGAIIDHVNKENEDKADYSIAFYMVLGFLLVDSICSLKLRVDEHQHQKEGKTMTREVLTVLIKPEVLLFLLAVFTIGACTGLLWNFLFIYVNDLGEQNDDKNMKLLMGLIMAVQCFLGELPFFFLSGKILKRTGHSHALSIVLLVFGLRFIIYSYLVDPWWVLPVEVSQGFTFGIFYSAMTSYAYVICSSQVAATMQGIFGGTFEGIGMAAGSLIGGVVYKHHGGSKTYYYFGIFSLGVCAFQFLMGFVIRFFSRKTNTDMGEACSLSGPPSIEKKEEIKM
ncbi:unnamed protein product [Darwinula stevensoni]|uniref:Major facilitator superfamily associated domain-containing protein n=1 Tax=Darwinula stevensoni TaxID=69355 RepID=A0A7R9A3E9_9CRUS|nr:unnamed protein product [Darwinula stevensoni]CAG0881978.1 unnamed protein product [Darwinula stevensoni]